MYPNERSKLQETKRYGCIVGTIGFIVLLWLMPSAWGVGVSPTPVVSGALAHPNLIESLTASPALDKDYWDSITPVAEWVESKKVVVEPTAPKRVSKPKVKPAEKRVPAKKALSEAEMVSLIERGCDKYDITGSDRKWVITAWLQVTWSESRWIPTAQNPNSTASGLAQFLAAWGSLENRLDPQWTANRFAKAFADGGKSNIRKHWRATIGGL